MIPDDRLQQIIGVKDHEEAQRWCEEHAYSEGWAIIDGAIVIYNIDDPPDWLIPVLELLDEDGYTPSFYERLNGFA